MSSFCCLICKACLILKIRGKIDLKINWSAKTLLDGHKGKRQRVDTTLIFSSSISIDWYQKSIIIEFYRLLARSRLQDSLAFFRSFALAESLAQAYRLSVYRLTTPDVGNDYVSCSKLDYENSWEKKNSNKIISLGIHFILNNLIYDQSLVQLVVVVVVVSLGFNKL